MEPEKRIPELVILPSQIDKGSSVWLKDFSFCFDCNSNLMYIVEDKGIIKEDNWYGIIGNKSNRTYRVTTISIHTHCAKCGSFKENYFKLFHDDEIVYTFDREMDEDERTEIEYCLSQFNQKRDFVPQYKFHELNVIKEKLLEFEKNYSEKIIKKTNKKKK